MNALDSVITYLLPLFHTATSVKVFDGPSPLAVAEQRFVLVGSTGEDEEAANILSTASMLGPGTWMDEAGEVVCSAWASSQNDIDLTECRQTAGGLAIACADAVRANRTLGGLLRTPSAHVSTFRYHPRQTTNGAVVRVLFTVAYQALIQ